MKKFKHNLGNGKFVFIEADKHINGHYEIYSQNGKQSIYFNKGEIMENETQIETVAETTQVETEEQKIKRKMPKYYLVCEKVGDATQVQLAEFSTKKDVKEYLEKNDGIENLNPVLILGHEVPLTFNKIVKVDF